MNFAHVCNFSTLVKLPSCLQFVLKQKAEENNLNT